MSQPINPPDFILIPRPLLIDDRLQPLDRTIFGYIYWFTKLKNERCTAGNKTLAELARCGHTSVQSALVRLERSGYITKIYAEGDKKNRLEIQCNLSFGGNVPSEVVTGTLKSGTEEEYKKKREEE